MRAGVLGVLVAAACQGKSPKPKQQPPQQPPPPARAEPSTADACKRNAQGEITKSDIAISKALAAQKLELFAPQFLPTPFDEPPRGAAPNPAEDKRRAEERAPFAGKHTGDVVTWMNAGQAVTGIYIEPAKEGWLIARKGTLNSPERAVIVAAKPATWREITCAEPRESSSGCAPSGPPPLLFALPAGTTFGGTLDLSAERVTLRIECR